MRDDRLLKKLRTDPENGMKMLIHQYAGLVYAVVRSKLLQGQFCEADVVNCVADTFSEFYCSLARYNPGKGSIKSLLCVIARSNALDCLRRYYRDKDTLSLEDAAVTHHPDDFSLEGNFEDKAVRQALLTAIIALGSPDKDILICKYYLNQSSKEIATALHMRVSAVDTRTHRAIQKLRKQFGGVNL